MMIENILIILPYLLFLLVVMLFVFFFLRSASRLDIEKEREELYTSWCSGAIDGLKKPIVRFSIYDDFVVISSLKKIVLYFSEITEVCQDRYFGAKGFVIKHNKKNVPNIMLMPRDFEKPLNIIKFKITGELPE